MQIHETPGLKDAIADRSSAKWDEHKKAHNKSLQEECDIQESILVAILRDLGEPVRIPISQLNVTVDGWINLHKISVSSFKTEVDGDDLVITLMPSIFERYRGGGGVNGGV